MKMRKLLATAVAATVAVTSLATVASAAELPFEMGQTTGTVKFTATTGKEVNFLADANGLAPAELGISADDTLAIDTTNATKKVTGVNLKVVGIKGSKANSPKTYTYAFGNYTGAVGAQTGKKYDWDTQKYDGSGSVWALKAYATTGGLDAFVPSQFVEITQISIEIACESSVKDVKAYDAYGNTNWGENIDGLQIDPFDNATWTNILMAINNALNVYTEDDTVSGTTGIYAAYSEKSTSIVYPFLPKTDDGNGTLTRAEIWKLSDADNYSATGGADKDVDGDQSYVGDDTTKGDKPAVFAGLASQVADFFNKQTNGTITFKFTTPAAAAGGSNWVTGGIPSTQTGIKNTVGAMSTNDIALFFNYDKTGSLQAVTSLDAASGSVTFDISDVLDALGGQTMGVLDDIYYGLNKGNDYPDDAYGVGLYVESVTLAYSEDADVEADIEDDAEIEDDTTVEEDDDVALEDDAEDEAPVEDDADEETDGDVIVETEDDDANPGTGVALAVVPALVAAAAVVVSKKRS